MHAGEYTAQEQIELCLAFGKDCTERKRNARVWLRSELRVATLKAIASFRTNFTRRVWGLNIVSLIGREMYIYLQDNIISLSEDHKKYRQQIHRDLIWFARF